MLKQIESFIFGARAIALRDRLSGDISAFEVLDGSVNADFSAEFADLFGGAAKTPRAREITAITGSVEATLKQVNGDWMRATIGAQVSTTAASASGSIVDLENIVGTSVIDGTTGIATVDILVGDDLKPGTYYITAESATEISVARDISGDGVQFLDDSYQVTGTDITIVVAAGSAFTDIDDVATFGIEFTGGSGAIALTMGDRAKFTVIPPHAGIEESIIPNQINIPEFELIVYSEQKSDGGYSMLTLPRVQASGLPLVFNVGEFSDTSTSFMLLECSLEPRGVFKIVKGVDQISC
jgi:hypothetical protein